MNTSHLTQEQVTRKLQIRMSYQTALQQYRSLSRLQRISWTTWLLISVSCVIWGITTYHVALATGAHNIRDILGNILTNAINTQPANDNALTQVLITYGAKYNPLIVQGQYWRFVTPIFLHANALHIGLNMLNLAVLGIFVERIVGHARLLLIYLVTGVISFIFSFYFAPQEVSVGASGAIFGLVGAYSVFVLMHRKAFPRGGLFALLWLVIVIGINLSIGVFIQNVDNYAHIGGLLSGCVLGWWFTPLYKQTALHTLVDTHSLMRRWPLAVLTILGTLLLAIIALYLYGTRS